MALTADRRVPDDWYEHPVPDGVDVHPDTYVDSAFVFCATEGRVRLARGSHVYAGSLFDVGAGGSIEVGECSMINGAYMICDASILIGAYATISWNVIFMDSYRVPFDPDARRALMIARGHSGLALAPRGAVSDARPVRLHDNVWIGFDACILPGVTIGEGSVVGARSVVAEDVPPYTIVAGNPARPIRGLPRPEGEVERP